MIQIRIFFAIEFNDQVKQYIYGIQQQIVQYCLKGNFAHIDNFHLTLKFIGEAGPEKITDFKKVIDETIAMQKGFSLNLNGIGCFPRGDKKIIWLGIDKNFELKQLHQNLERVLYRYGCSIPEGEYKPHITLGREVVSKCDFNEVRETVITKSMKIQVTGLSLMESVRVDGRLVYMPLYKKETS